MYATPVTGAVTVESRIGTSHDIVFQFNSPVSATGTPTVVDKNMVALVGVTVAAPVINGSEVTVTITGVPERQRFSVLLPGVNASNSSTIFSFFLLPLLFTPLMAGQPLM